MGSKQRRVLRLTKTACSPEMASTLVPNGRRRPSAVCTMALVYFALVDLDVSARPHRPQRMRRARL